MNILVLTAKFGMGHVSAAEAVKEKIEDKYEGANVTVVDTIDYLFPSLSGTAYSAFNVFSRKYHRLYNMLIKVDGHSIGMPMKKWFISKFQRLVDKYEPDLIVSTWPVGSKYIGAYKQRTGSDIPYITCITDISAHSEWISKATSAYVVGDSSIKRKLIRKGVASDRIFVGGIPVKREFRKTASHDASRNKKEVLIMGGGLGLIPNAEEMLDYLNARDDTHTTLITGGNKKMFDQLSGRYANVEVIGYSNEVDKYMKKADMIITKAGGITMFEAINTETPMMVIDPFLEQEKSNAKFIERKGIGIIMRHHIGGYTKRYLERVLDDESALRTMKENMVKITSETNGHGIEAAMEELKRREECKAA